MSRKQLVIYSNKDFREGERLERIYMAMMEPERFEPLLTLDEEDYRRKLEMAYQKCYKELRRSVAVKYIQENVAGCETLYRANRVLDDMQELFGRFLDKNKQLKQSILVEKMYEDAEMIRAMAAKVKDEGRYDAAADMLEKANNIRERAAKIEGLDKLQLAFRPEEFRLPTVTVTSDPRVLKQGYDEAEIDNEEKE
jgi:tetratricopeptide (TPR) repeat protein